MTRPASSGDEKVDGDGRRLYEGISAAVDACAAGRTAMRLVGRGLSNANIGRAMGINTDTVKNYLTSIFAKLRVRRMEAVARAGMYGII